MTEMIIDEETEMNERQEAIDEAKTAESEPRKSQGGPNGPIGKPMQKAAPGTTKRIFGYIFQYKWRVAIVVLCILIGAAAQSGSALFLQSLIDSYILPMVGANNPDWGPLLRALTLMGCLYAAGILCSWLWQWLIVTVEQGVLKKIRDDMFAHQQSLPIRYFDTNEHGDIMSRYTNDTDTLRQAISQSFPQMFSSAITAIAALISMLWLSVPVTVFVLVFSALLFVVVRKVVSRSGRYFVKQQIEIGDVNAFVEESVNGQKVIKVFNHEDATQKDFDEKNERLFEASAEANTWGNVTMPIVGNMGYIVYPACRSRWGHGAVGRRQLRPVRIRYAHLGYADFIADPVPSLHQSARTGLHAVQHGDDGARRRIPYLPAYGRKAGRRWRFRDARQRGALLRRSHHDRSRLRNRSLGLEA